MHDRSAAGQCQLVAPHQPTQNLVKQRRRGHDAQLKDVKSQVPQAICTMYTGNVPRNLLVNRNAPPFDNPELRRAMSLSIDHQTFIDILSEGKGDNGGVMQPPPSGLWGMPAE